MKYSKIIMIDDDDDDLELFTLALQKISSNFECTVFNSAIEALKELDAKTMSPDLIFLDLNMPRMTGQQFLRELQDRKGLQKIPIIVVSTSSRKETIREAKDLGAMDFITKPDQFSELVSVLKSLLLP